ncbi:transmembrane protein, putative (macronuclear) [Tetrahymena thermophila SB210]|uniref:Transmembrane protein, putative n=1 Tax=Tetrahymena thermophila (strain SB210) TaxID=312017 RepID=Q22UY3_TETTS|nr:transmembrane protein, putative [Tetrahymena thermophila SB210]EAR89165.1 transmembrane protein, putative [Tetrahymena thermophila SB210]|eukprot:XP_001009410.1 transmembrane protein, putative [Tetrahymena thermophila SB210]
MKKNILILILIIAVLGCVVSKQITVPLRLSKDNQLYFSSNYGSAQCQVDFFISINHCNNSIQQSNDVLEKCGAKYVEKSPQYNGKNYKSKFQLGDQSYELTVTSPNTDKSSFYGYSILCLGFIKYDFQLNAIQQLHASKQIAEQKFFITLNNTAPSSVDQVIGQLDFGTPDTSIASINNFVQIKKQYSVVSYGAESKNYFNYGQEQIQSDDTIYFNLDSAFTGISIESFQKLISLLEQQGVAYEFISEKNALFVNSIDKLQALQFVLSQVDNKPYILTINPTQYTKKLSDNKFQIMIQPQYTKGFSFLGYNVLESYYVGFDLSTKSVLIAEKKQVQSEQY